MTHAALPPKKLPIQFGDRPQFEDYSTFRPLFFKKWTEQRNWLLTLGEAARSHIQEYETHKLWINVYRDYGADPTGETDSLPAFESAVEEALSTGYPIYIPAGTYYLEFSAVNPSLEITGDISIFGDGMYNTTLVIGPESPTWATSVFHVTSDAGSKVLLSGFTMQGPTSPGPYPETWDGSHSARNNPASSGVKVVAQTTAGGFFFLTDIRTTGKLFTPVHVQGGNGTAGVKVFLRDCDLDGYETCVSMFQGAAVTDGVFVAVNTYFRHGGVLDNYPGDVYYGHLLYIHPHVALELYGCRFGDAGQGNSINHYSSSLEWQFGSHNLLLGCVFEESAGVVKTSDTTPTSIVGGEFYGGSITARHRLSVTDVTFKNGSSVTSDGASFVHITGCKFLYYSKITMGTSTTRWQIVGCLFDNTPRWRAWRAGIAYALTDYVIPTNLYSMESRLYKCTVAGTSHAATEPTWPTSGTVTDNTVTWTHQGLLGAPVQFITGGNAALHVVVVGCTFKGVLNKGSPSYPNAAIECAGSQTWTVQDCVFDGADYQYGCILGDGTTANVSLYNNRFVGTGNAVYGSFGTGLLRGRDNDFGSMQLAVQGSSRGEIQSRRGVNPSTLSSAADLNIGYNHDTALVSGTTTVENIYHGGTAAKQKGMGGYIVLIPTGAWAFSTAGNIDAEVHARATNVPIRLWYDNSADKWREDRGTLRTKGAYATFSVASHGFAVGDPLYKTAGGWAKARANAIGTICDGIVAEVPDTNTFVLCSSGFMTWTSHGKTVGTRYYLDPAAAGGYTTTRTTTSTEVIQNAFVPITASQILVQLGHGEIVP